MVCEWSCFQDEVQSLPVYGLVQYSPGDCHMFWLAWLSASCQSEADTILEPVLKWGRCNCLNILLEQRLALTWQASSWDYSKCELFPCIKNLSTSCAYWINRMPSVSGMHQSSILISNFQCAIALEYIFHVPEFPEALNLLFLFQYVFIWSFLHFTFSNLYPRARTEAQAFLHSLSSTTLPYLLILLWFLPSIQAISYHFLFSADLLSHSSHFYIEVLLP